MLLRSNHVSLISADQNHHHLRSGRASRTNADHVEMSAMEMKNAIMIVFPLINAGELPFLKFWSVYVRKQNFYLEEIIFSFSWKFLLFKLKCFRLYFAIWSIFYEFWIFFTSFFYAFFSHIRNNCYGNDKCVMECGKPIIIEPDRCRGCNQNCPGNQPPLIWRCEPGKSLYYVQIPKNIFLSDFVSNPDLLRLYMDSNLEIDANGISGRVCLNDKTRLDLIRLNAILMSVDRKWDVMSCVQQEIKKKYVYLFVPLYNTCFENKIASLNWK